MSTYCIIGKVKLTQIEGAKTLQLAHFGGLTFAVSKDFVEDKLYAIFLPDGQLSKEYYEANKEHLSFFGKNLKVRSIKLMQGKIISAGYIADLESLNFTGYDISQLKEGDNFNDLNGVKVCKKFVTEFTRSQSVKTLSKKAKMVLVGLPEHKDTDQFFKFANTLEVGDLITITLKLDGCVERSTVVDTLEFGDIEIGYIVDNKVNCHIKSYNIITNSIEYQPIIDWFFRNDTTNWYEIELENGKKITITGNNPVWLDNLRCYREARLLQAGDKLTIY